MSFVQPSGGTSRRNAAIAVAVVFHLVLVWGLMNGLGRSVIQAIKAPIETHIIEEVKPPPPPPKVIEMPPPPAYVPPPPPAYVPPPEVQVQAPPAPQPTITAAIAETPPAPPPPVVPRVEAPPAPAPVAPPPAPTRVSASVACSNFAKVMGDAAFPREAQRFGLEEGSALVQFTLTAAGEIKDVKPVEASHPVFGRGAVRIAGDFKCAGQGHDVIVQVPFVFNSK
jgi:periplasmic protein TonB